MRIFIDIVVYILSVILITIFTDNATIGFMGAAVIVGIVDGIWAQVTGRKTDYDLDDITIMTQGTPVERAMYNQLKKNNRNK